MKNYDFRALVVEQTSESSFRRTIKQRSTADLPDGDVLINVRYSSLNYKDALSASGNKGVTKNYPHTPGIDAAGIVVESQSPEFKTGDQVIVTGYDLGMNTSGGFGQYIRVPSGWVVPLPDHLSLRESMIYGTAGFTAALSVYRLQQYGLKPGMGDILVTGASGGVGSIAVGILAREGFKVTASTGKSDVEKFLSDIGAAEIIGRQEVTDTSGKLLLRGRWAGSVDTVGGEILATTIKSTKQRGVITACGNVASPDLNLNVYPFILRGVSLVGIDSAESDMEFKRLLWLKISTEWKLDKLNDIAIDCSLDDLDHFIELILQGKIRGRVVVDLDK
jgi:acrylyl-CoA reductase (NADPH)